MHDYYQHERREWGQKPPLCIDFDGVMATYDGHYAGPIGAPAPGLREFLGRLTDKFTVTILTARDVAEVWEWLEAHAFMPYIDNVTNVKPPAYVYIDDRAVGHRGSFGETISAVEGFRPHWWGR